MVDLSFIGDAEHCGSITVQSGSMASDDLEYTTIEDFPEDEEPITAEQIEVIDHQFTLNGELFRTRKPVVYMVGLSVIPETANDESLRSLLISTAPPSVDSGQDVTAPLEKSENVTITIYSPSGNTFKFEDGNIISGPPAISVDGEGKMRTNHYQFVFGKFTQS